jgi:hypothetical protein
MCTSSSGRGFTVAKRLFAILGDLKQVPRVRHFVGLPPELAGGREGRVGLSLPSVLVLKEDSEAGVMFDRYTRNGSTAGDTWHENFAHAMEQAEFEYGDAVGEWREVPAEIEDPVSYALNQIP